MAGFGHIGSFYFGPEQKNVYIKLSPLILDFSFNDFETSLDNSIHQNNLSVVIRTLKPEVYTYDSIEVDFSASPLYGKSPLEVEFTAIPKLGVNFSASIVEYQWCFDYDNYPLEIETTSATSITHSYTGKDGDKFSVKLTIVIDPSDGRTLYKLKTDYIEIQKSSKRFGVNKVINLTNYVPEYLQYGDSYYLVKVFEDYLNEMYDGDAGNVVTSAYDSGYETFFIESTNSDKISILEKIYRLTDLNDPELIDINNIQYFANNYGYNINVNRDQFGVIGNSVDEVEDYMRFMVSNLSNWYKIKTTRNSLKSMLFSFGLIGDVVYYYTKDYSDDEINWKYGDIFFDVSDGKLKEDLSQIPSDWYPTSHFSVWYDINKSNTNYSYDTSKQKQIVNAIESVRPANTVFRGIVGRWKTNTILKVNEVHRVRKAIKINSTNADFWNV